MDIYAISILKEGEEICYYLDKLVKYNDNYYWETGAKNISDDYPVYFYKHKKQDVLSHPTTYNAIVKFQEKHLRFMTTKKALKEKKHEDTLYFN